MFPNSVFSHLDVPEPFGGETVAPFDACGVVVVYWDWFRHDEVGDLKIYDEMGYLLELFDAFVGCVYF